MRQLDKLRPLLLRGCTSVEICRALPSVSPHRRLSDAKAEGWVITWKQEGKLKKYFGKPPKGYE